QFELGSMGFTGVVLGRVVHGAQLGLTIQGVGVDVDLGIQAVQVAIGLDDQRVDFQQGQIVVGEQFAQADEDVGELLDLVAFQAQFEGQVTTLVRLRAYQGVDGGFQDLLGSLFGNLLDFNAALGGRHEYDTASGAIHYGTQVELLSDVSAGRSEERRVGS